MGPITRFDTEGFKAKLAAEVKDFNPADFGMDVPTQRRMDKFTQYAVAAAKQAVEESGIVGTVEPSAWASTSAAASAACPPLSSRATASTSAVPAASPRSSSP